VRAVERQMQTSAPGMQGELTRRLDELDRRARDLPMPGLLTESTYNLWANIREVRARMHGAAATATELDRLRV
jgi:hypothetical protein